MSELRKDLVAERWVIISPRRGKRPHQFKNETKRPLLPAGPCAFCYGHEHETGPETLAFRDADKTDGPCWTVRVVENMYPAVSADLETEESTTSNGSGTCEGVKIGGFGSHEVVIETPEHDKTFAQLPVSQIQEIFKAYQCRVQHLRFDKRFKFVQIFKNHGNAAGASMSHSHSQIIALPIIARAMEEDLAGKKNYYEKHSHQCVLCNVIHQSTVVDKLRLVDERPDFVTYCPYAPRFPYETWILPRNHNCNFDVVSHDELKGLADVMKTTLQKMDKLFNYPPYNFMLHTAPLQDGDLPYFHWYIRIVPHLITLAGFELGSGCHINPVSPEDAAHALRDIKLDD